MKRKLKDLMLVQLLLTICWVLGMAICAGINGITVFIALAAYAVLTTIGLFVVFVFEPFIDWIATVNE